MSVEDMLKQIMTDQAKLASDVRQNQLATQNLEKQLGKLASAHSSRQQWGLPGNTDPNPKQVDVVSTRSGRPLTKLAPKAQSAKEKGKEQVGQEGEPSGSKAIEEPKTKPPPSFPQKFKKKKEEECFAKFIDLLKQVQINLPLIDVLQEIPKYAKFVKDIVVNKSKLAEFVTVALTKEYSSRILNKIKLPTKLKDPGSFTVQVTIGKYSNTKGICDLSASINLMPRSMLKKLGLGELKATTILLQLADHSVARPDGIIEDVLVQVGSLIFPVDFFVLDF
ncbi:uncharacterized protein LOC129872531 [Solanum dulcamara]|uniref:uncharacterized protein LOC129872531 n=1 Tax=Solanum dulcamara TaxID=45834 RepID=UPI002485230F|nr:uncharacterized protein LOC129872531 [Solanum dulcamara]